MAHEPLQRGNFERSTCTYLCGKWVIHTRVCLYSTRGFVTTSNVTFQRYLNPEPSGDVDRTYTLVTKASNLDLSQWKRDVAKTSLNFKDTRYAFAVPLAVNTNLLKTSSKLHKTHIHPSWAEMLGQDRPGKKSAK